jgi:hypothetical protein
MAEWRCSSTILDLGGEWLASHPGRFIPGERAPGTHWTLWSRQKSLASARNQIPAVQPVGRFYTD